MAQYMHCTVCNRAITSECTKNNHEMVEKGTKTSEILLFDLNGPEGNIFYILGTVIKVLTEAGHKDLAEEVKSRVPQAKSYEEAKAIVSEYAEVIYLE